MDCRVLLMNGLNTAGDQVATIMDSLGAFSASLPFLFLSILVCALFLENPFIFLFSL